MSTKIYEAYVIENVDLMEKFTTLYRNKCFNLIAKDIKMYMKCVTDGYISKRKSEIKNDVMLKYSEIDDWIRLEYVFKECFKMSKRSESDPFNFDCGLNMFLYGGKFYVIPYNPSKKFKMTHISGVKDFSYWNNSDAPENVTKEEWYDRGEMWDKMIDDWNKCRFSYEVFDGKDMYCRGQEIVEKKILKSPIKDQLMSACFSAAMHAEEEDRKKVDTTLEGMQE